jgi:hypothetical protein
MHPELILNPIIFQPDSLLEARDKVNELYDISQPIFVDAMKPCKRNKNWNYDYVVHLFTLPDISTAMQLEQYLHAFANKIGLKRIWYQKKSTMRHYDITKTKKKQAIYAGAIELNNYMTAAVIGLWGDYARSRKITKQR